MEESKSESINFRPNVEKLKIPNEPENEKQPIVPTDEIIIIPE